MKVHELAKRTGIKNAVILKENPELKSHMSNVPEDIVAKYLPPEEPLVTETVDIATEETATVVVEPAAKGLALPDGVTAERVWLNVMANGARGRFWKYRALAKAPANYKGNWKVPE